MLRLIKERIAEIASEVNELHPLLQEVFRRHPKITSVERTHGQDEKGADFILSRLDDVLGDSEYIGVVAKRGKIHTDLTDVNRQIWECTNLPHKIEGGKKEVALSQVWIVSTGTITNGAQERIHAKYRGTNVKFINGDRLASMVDELVPFYWARVDLPVSTYLSDVKARSEQLDKTLDLMQLEGESLHIDQDVVHVEIDPYNTEKRKKRRKIAPVDVTRELATNKALLIEADMGGGKSKLIRRLAQHYGDVATFTEEKLLPIHATFRELIDDYGSDLHKLLTEKIPNATQEALTDDVVYLFLIDAVDEKAMPPEELSETLAAVANAVHEEQRYKLVLTSRHISNVDFDKRLSNSLARYEIAPLSVTRIVRFLNVICHRLNLHTRIIEDLQRSNLFDHLPRNPIAAVLLGQLLTEKNQRELPSTMTELYQKYMELSLGRWDMQKGLQSQQEFETLQNVLMELAAYVIENELEAINAQEVEGMFRKYLDERNFRIEAKQLVDQAVDRANVLARSSDSYVVWFKHRSFAEFLYAKWLLSRGTLQPDNRAFEMYWTNVYFFALGLQKDAPELLEALIDLPPQDLGHRWMKLFNLADFLMAAYSTPYRVINRGVLEGILEAARLFNDAAEGRAASPFDKLSRMQLLYFIQLVTRDNYGYEFLAPALEEAAAKLLENGEETQIRAYAVFLVCVAYIDAGRGESFDWLLEDFEGYLPLDLRLALWHEGDELETRNKAIKKLRRNVEAALSSSAGFRKEARDLHRRPVVLLEQEDKNYANHDDGG